jgi:signal transduction histidine kinase
MTRLVLAFAVALSLGLAAIQGIAAEFGTADEAKAMLERAVAAINADEPKALAEFSRKDGGFIDRDLYVFCAGADGIIDGHPNPDAVGTDLKTQTDKKGNLFGDEMFKVAQTGTFNTVSYLWTRLGSTDPVVKVAYVTKVKDQVCGVGYYK